MKSKKTIQDRTKATKLVFRKVVKRVKICNGNGWVLF